MNMTINLILVSTVAAIAVLIVVSSTVVLIVSLVISSFTLTIVVSLLLIFKRLIVIHELIDRGDAGLSIGFDEDVFPGGDAFFDGVEKDCLSESGVGISGEIGKVAVELSKLRINNNVINFKTKFRELNFEFANRQT